MKTIQKKEATAYKAKLITCGYNLSKQWYVCRRVEPSRLSDTQWQSFSSHGGEKTL